MNFFPSDHSTNPVNQSITPTHTCHHNPLCQKSWIHLWLCLLFLKQISSLGKLKCCRHHSRSPPHPTQPGFRLPTPMPPPSFILVFIIAVHIIKHLHVPQIKRLQQIQNWHSWALTNHSGTQVVTMTQCWLTDLIQNNHNRIFFSINLNKANSANLSSSNSQVKIASPITTILPHLPLKSRLKFYDLELSAN